MAGCVSEQQGSADYELQEATPQQKQRCESLDREFEVCWHDAGGTWKECLRSIKSYGYLLESCCDLALARTPLFCDPPEALETGSYVCLQEVNALSINQLTLRHLELPVGAEGQAVFFENSSISPYGESSGSRSEKERIDDIVALDCPHCYDVETTAFAWSEYQEQEVPSSSSKYSLRSHESGAITLEAQMRWLSPTPQEWQSVGQYSCRLATEEDL
jgi:hypothetical protein